MRSVTAVKACAGIAALVLAGAAGAQQNIPGIPKAPSSPSAPRGDSFGRAPALDDNCALAVSAKELDALRDVILGLLAKSPSKRDEFLKAEADVPADCARQKAVFYMRSLVLARGKG